MAYLRSKDRRHYTRFVTAYLDPVARLAERIVGCPHDASDVVQEAFLRLADRDLSPDEIQSPRSYVLKTVVNVARNQRRREGTRVRHHLAASKLRANAERSTEQVVIERESVRRIYEAIDKLDDEFRITLHLRAVESLSYREIAEVTDVPVQTVSSRIHRARAELKRVLGAVVFAPAMGSLETARDSGLLPLLDDHCTEKLWELTGLKTGVIERLRQEFTGPATKALWAVLGLIVAPAALMILNDALRDRHEVPVSVSRSRFEREEAGSWSVSDGSHNGRTPEGDSPMTPVARMSTVVAASIGLAAAAQKVPAEPGDLISHIPAQTQGPMDITHDPSDGTFWVTSFFEHEIHQYSGDLRRVLSSRPVPFENPLNSMSTGIAYNPDNDTIFVVDSVRAEIHELDREGKPVGVPISVPLGDEVDFVRGIAYDPDGNGGRGSLYVTLSQRALALEISLSGGQLRSFPDPDDPDRFGGLDGLQLLDIEPIREVGEVVGFYVAASGGNGRLALLRLDEAGRATGLSMSLNQADSEDIGGILRRSFPHPDTGVETDSYVCSVPVNSKFSILEGGEPQFLPINGLACEVAARRVSLSWSRSQVYDSIEILRGCEVLEVLPGTSVSWERTFEEDGVYELSVCAKEGFSTTETDTCIAVVGRGQVLRQSGPHDIPAYGSDMASDGERLVVTISSPHHGRKLWFFDFDLQPIGSVDISEFFFGGDTYIGGVARGPEPRQFYLYDITTKTFGRVDYQGHLIDTFPLRLDGIRPAPSVRPTFGAITSMSFDETGDDGRGTLWLLCARRNTLYEVDRSGTVLSQVPHPLLDASLPPPGFSLRSGMSLAKNSPGFAWTTIQVKSPLHGPFRRHDHLLLVNLDTGNVERGAELSTAGLGPHAPRAIQHVLVGGESRFFLVGHERLYELSLRPHDVPPPTLLFGASRLDDTVDLRFNNNGPYDTVEIIRDCEKVADLDGEAESFQDFDAPTGWHEYRVRGVRTNQPSDSSVFSLRVGRGGIVQRVVNPAGSRRHIFRDPVDGTFYAVGDGDRHYTHLDTDLTLIGELPSDWTLRTATMRLDADGHRLFVAIVSSPAGHRLVTETYNGDFVSDLPIDASVPIGLVWDPVSDTFFFQEKQRLGRVFKRVDRDGNIIATFAHPAPPIGLLMLDVGATLVPSRRSMLVFGAEPGDRQISKIIEVGLDGALTGYEVMTSPEETGVAMQGIAWVGRDVVCLAGGTVLRIKMFDEAPEAPAPPSFIRGDANGDIEVNLTDAIYLLNFLFLGGLPPPCEDAADSDDDGTLLITDSVYLLNFLFLGGTVPPPPRPDLGTDPTPDSLSCVRGR